MNRPFEEYVLKKALTTFGPKLQTIKAIEEMSELQKEFCKELWGEGDKEHIAEEIADVLIMLQQMIMLHDLEARVKHYREAKVGRLAERLQKGEP